ncbi:ThiJ/PfpI family protein [Lasiosphaeris hirsuta]|uniref:ThiJ/PfpI family protein n=1 Tax=Lasiosphaeris hirsuta TaxID=260670 RepID=A0AA40A2H8_9PEZI|nr:ThiJ/PfpI family protein [Lasiosphaeris hirsuta]
MGASTGLDAAIAPKGNVLLVLFPGFNTLDMNGPYEILQKSKVGNAFGIKVAAENEITVSVEGVQVKRDLVLDDDLIARLHEYDVLVVPGGTMGPVNVQASDVGGPFMNLLAAFAQLGPTPGANPRILLSVCTGAIFLGALGIFNEHLCTTHWASYDALSQRVKDAAARTQCHRPGRVVATRYVDSGLNSNGVRIISSGGISCGIDASLHVVKLRCGEAEAIKTSQLLDYAWRKTEGVVFWEDSHVP